jgi:hypothetical protein
MLLRL